MMNSRDTLVLKVLQFKALHNGADTGRFIDALLEQNPESAEALTKNVCARIPKPLAERMENMGKLLDALDDDDDVQNAWTTLENEEDLDR